MAILVGVTQLNKSGVSDVMSNKILKEWRKKKEQCGSRRPVNRTPFEAFFFLKFFAVTENQSRFLSL